MKEKKTRVFKGTSTMEVNSQNFSFNSTSPSSSSSINNTKNEDKDVLAETLQGTLEDMNYVLVRLLTFTTKQKQTLKNDSSIDYSALSRKLIEVLDNSSHNLNILSESLKHINKKSLEHDKNRTECSSTSDNSLTEKNTLDSCDDKTFFDDKETEIQIKINKSQEFSDTDNKSIFLEPEYIEENNSGCSELNKCEQLCDKETKPIVSKKKFNLSLKKHASIDSTINSSIECKYSEEMNIDQTAEDLINTTKQINNNIIKTTESLSGESYHTALNPNSNSPINETDWKFVNIKTEITDEIEIVEHDIFLSKTPDRDEELEYKPDIKSIPLEINSKQVTDKYEKCEENKNSFLNGLDLKPVILQTEIAEISDSESHSSSEISEKIDEIFDELLNTHKNSLLVDTSDFSCKIDSEESSISSSEYDEDFNCIPGDIPDFKAGRIANISFELPNRLKDELKLKQCSVVLYDIYDKNFVSTLSTEDKEIFKLSNLHMFKQKRKRSTSTSSNSSTSADSDRESEIFNKRKKTMTKKRRALSTESEYFPSDENNFDASDSEDKSVVSLRLHYADKNISDVDDLMNENSNDTDSDIIFDSEEEVKDKNKKLKKDMPNKIVDNESIDLLNNDNEQQNEEELELEQNKPDKNWRNDSLLRGNLSETDTSDFEKKNKKCSNSNFEAPKGPTDILPEELIDKLEKKKTRERRKSGSSVSSIAASDSDKTDINSSDSSDVEFIELTSPENDDEMHSPGKTGRKNIRDIQEESESAKLARMEEENRQKRLTQLEQERTQSQKSDEQLILDLDKITKKPRVSVHPELVMRMKQHQKEGVKFMWDACFESLEHLKNNPGNGCILGHCMGLGKSFQIVSLVHTLMSHPEIDMNHVLIVCPLSTVPNWLNEFKIALDHIDNVVKVFSITDKQKTKTEKIAEVHKWHKVKGVLLMGYETFTSLVKDNKLHFVNKEALMSALCDPGPQLLVCDEGHNLKNGKTNRYKSLKLVATKRKIILTGTPLQNNLMEYYHMVQFIKPKLLGSEKEFANRFANPIRNGQYADSTHYDIEIMKKRSHVLHKMLKSTVQRYERSELEKYLFGKQDYVIFIKIHPIQVKLYEEYVEHFVGTDRSPVKHFPYMQILWTHPRILTTSNIKNLKKETDTVEYDTIDVDAIDEPQSCWWEDICPPDYKENLDYGPKFKVMLEIISECERFGDKVLIFSSRLGEMDAIEYFLQNVGTPNCPKWIPNVDYFRMDGQMPPMRRPVVCDKFNSDNKRARVFIISHRVGGLGLNLVGANRVILMDVNFNPSADSQSVMRVYRFGQKKVCYVYRLVSMGTMEEVIYERCVTKLAIAGRVVDEKQIDRHFNENEITTMFRCQVNFDDAITNEQRQKTIELSTNDVILKKILDKFPQDICKYVEHQSLLENLPEEELNEEQRKQAWVEFKQLQETEAEALKYDREQNQRLQMLMAQPSTSAGINKPLGIVSHGRGMDYYATPQNNAMINMRNNRNQQIATEKSSNENHQQRSTEVRVNIPANGLNQATVAQLQQLTRNQIVMNGSANASVTQSIDFSGIPIPTTVQHSPFQEQYISQLSKTLSNKINNLNYRGNNSTPVAKYADHTKHFRKAHGNVNVQNNIPPRINHTNNAWQSKMTNQSASIQPAFPSFSSSMNPLISSKTFNNEASPLNMSGRLVQVNAENMDTIPRRPSTSTIQTISSAPRRSRDEDGEQDNCIVID